MHQSSTSTNHQDLLCRHLLHDLTSCVALCSEWFQLLSDSDLNPFQFSQQQFSFLQNNRVAWTGRLNSSLL